MQATWTINGLDVSRLLAEDGVSYSEIYRQSRGIITLDGMLEQTQVIKRGLSLTFMTLQDRRLAELTAALKARPVTMIYTEKDGSAATRLFYVTGFSGGVKVVRGGNTYWTGVQLELEER